MNIPQEELDKLNDTEGLFDEHAEEEPMIPDEVVKVEEKVSLSPEKDIVEEQEPARVPYSRFEKFHERAIRAEERQKMLEEQLESFKRTEEPQVNVPDEWIELYGDSEASTRAYMLQVQSLERIREETTSKILDDIEKKQEAKQNDFKEKLEYIEEELDEFKNKLGRDLTETEESSLLDIQDEFTPKDQKGNYIAPLLSPDKAFEIYNLKQQAVKNKTAQARRKVVSITNSDSEGESSVSAFDNYRPGVSGLWRNRL